MAQFNENIKIVAPNPIDDRYLSSRISGGAQLPYSGTSEVTGATGIPLSQRYEGLTVLIESGTSNTEYWFKNGISNSDLVLKTASSGGVTGDFITGATNLGFFSGQTGIQTLELAFGFDPYNSGDVGNYISEYNNYYLESSSNVIRLGSVDNTTLRRAYITDSRLYSWVFSDAGTWVILNGDAAANVGNSLGPPVFTSVFTEEEWSTDVLSGSTAINVSGSLTTGDTLTIGVPSYFGESNQELRFRTIKSLTPNYLRAEFDNNFITLSGASSTSGGQNVGGGNTVYSGQSGTSLVFRTLVQSGDTTIAERSDGTLVIYSSSDGSGEATTGVTTVGVTGSTSIYSGKTDRNLYFRNIIGTGNTEVSLMGSGDSSTVLINSTGAGVFDEDITVSIAAGKTFGKYKNEDVIPASGKSANWVILDALSEALAPDVSLSSSGDYVLFGATGKTIYLDFDYTINSAGAAVSGVTLEWRRGTTGSWSALTTNIGWDEYTHEIDDSGDRFNTDTLYYRYTVTDTMGAQATATYERTLMGYAPPSISLGLNGSISALPTGDETQTSREKGNVDGGTTSGSIVHGADMIHVAITDWALEKSIDGGAYAILDSGSALETQNITVPAHVDNTNPSDAETIVYRLTYTDEYTSGIGGVNTISFFYYSYYGYDPNTTVGSAEILTLESKDKLVNQNLTWNSITVPAGEYAYYVFPSTYTNITTIERTTPAPPETTAWTNVSNSVPVTNSYGESLNYRVWRTKATEAYSGVGLIFS